MSAATTRAAQQPFRRPNRSALAAGDVRERHGGRRLATGVTITAAIVIAADLLRAMLMAPFYPVGVGPWAAWLSLAAILCVGVVSRLLSRANPLPDWLYVALLGRARRSRVARRDRDVGVPRPRGDPHRRGSRAGPC